MSKRKKSVPDQDFIDVTHNASHMFLEGRRPEEKLVWKTEIAIKTPDGFGVRHYASYYETFEDLFYRYHPQMALSWMKEDCVLLQKMLNESIVVRVETSGQNIVYSVLQENKNTPFKHHFICKSWHEIIEKSILLSVLANHFTPSDLKNCTEKQQDRIFKALEKNHVHMNKDSANAALFYKEILAREVTKQVDITTKKSTPRRKI